MKKTCSIRAKLLIMILSIIAPILIIKIIYLNKGFQSIETAQGYLYNHFVLKMYRRSLFMELLFTGVIMLGLFIMSFLVEKYIIKPLSVLQTASKKFIAGDYSARVNIKSKDEIGLVAASFNTMADNIENLSRSKQGFFTHILHEFKTPLNVIFSSVQLVDTYKKNTDCETYRKKASKQIKIIQQNCLRMMRLTTNLIDINRHDNGFLKIKLDNYDIVKLIRDITKSVKRYTESKGINLLFETSVQSRITACDPDMIERIILNLISNAIKFTDKNGVITVKISELEKHIMISVSDTGIGISEKRCNSIFELFNRDDADGIRNKEGTGIGLYLVKALVEAHDGEIKATSEVSIGTTFNITLPVRILEKGGCPSPGESAEKYLKSSESENLISRINIEFSDIYSCYDDDNEIS